MGKDLIPLARDEIEVTPEMIEAGISRLLEYRPEGDIEEEAAREIFLAM